jgi:indole-3-glycerol phosphate synthase
MILDRIVAYKRNELEKRKRIVPQALLETYGDLRPPPADFGGALRGEEVALIAEVKKASPSRGVLCLDFDPEALANEYVNNGAAAISVLTDTNFFQGGLDDLARVRQSVGPDVPLLRKDFVFDPYQVFETRAYGADALLLIAAILSDEMLGQLCALTQRLGLTALVEVHDEEEVARVLPLEPRVVGINNRDLNDFCVDLSTFGRLRPLLPEGTTTVAESGVRNSADVRRLAEMGADAVLVGEALVTAPDVAGKVRELALAREPVRA